MGGKKGGWAAAIEVEGEAWSAPAVWLRTVRENWQENGFWANVFFMDRAHYFRLVFFIANKFPFFNT